MQNALRLSAGVGQGPPSHPPEESPVSALPRVRGSSSTAMRASKVLMMRAAARSSFFNSFTASGRNSILNHAGYWRWRIGDYRVVARVEDQRITILVVRVV
ncbi:MAG: type II toxin-antitoxin system RelE family toxin [Sphingobium sp.]